MNVTFLIGNGFDLGIGLKTGYKDFLEYYLASKSININVNKFKEQIKRESIDLWADFEINFGRYIENFGNDNIHSYIEIYEDVLNEMNKYLKGENGRIYYNKINDNVDIFSNYFTLNNLTDIGLRPAKSYKFKNDTEYYYSRNVTHDFLVFNYTDALDRIIAKILEIKSGMLGRSETKGSWQNAHNVGNILHIHGKLDDYLILGVNDEKQLPFASVLPDEIRNRVIKPVKNVTIESRVEEEGTEIINRSNIICIYGMSIGETDAIWWERIGKWLESKEAKRIIYFVYNSSIDTKSVTAIDYLIDHENTYRTKLLKSLKISKNQWDSLGKKIEVIINSKFMQIPIVFNSNKAPMLMRQ